MLIRIVPHVRLSTGYGRTSYEDYREILEHAQVGDIIVSTDRAKLATILIPGKWSHIGLVTHCDDRSVMITEAVMPMVRETSLYDFCRTSDSVALFRHKGFSELRGDEAMANRQKVAGIAKSLIGVSYDTMFTFGPEALYCAELIDRCYLEYASFDWTDAWGIGAPYLTPDGVVCSEDLYCVYQARLSPT